ncbi:protein LHY-like isoform X2 [Wolffia australiana]
MGLGPTFPSGRGKDVNTHLTQVPSSSSLNSKEKAEDPQTDSGPTRQDGSKSQKRVKESNSALSLFHVAPPCTPSSSKPEDIPTEDESQINLGTSKMSWPPDRVNPESQRFDPIPGMVKDPSPSAITSVHQSHPTFPTSFSWSHISPAFSGHIMSTLLQNPAAHAAANMAAAFWLTADAEAVSSCVDSPPGGAAGQPSMAAAAAATVAAASAWWATHGLLPFCYPPFNGCFAAFGPPPPPVGPNARTHIVQASPLEDEGEDQKTLVVDPSPPLTVDPKGSPISSSDSNPSEKGKVKVNATVHQKSTLDAESVRGNSKIQVDRSSSGSNTPGSEAEGEPKEEDPAIDPSRQVVDLRKEVSKEGRLAFQALFSREVLPQSFSPPQEKGKEKETSSLGGAEEEGGEKRVKVQSAAFKPYKRCAVEAKEGKPAPEEEDYNKRIHLERETST